MASLVERSIGLMLRRSDFKSKRKHNKNNPEGFPPYRLSCWQISIWRSLFPATESLMDVPRWHPRWDNAASHVQEATLTSVVIFWEDCIVLSDWQTLFTGVWSGLGVSDPPLLYYLILITLVTKWNPILYQFTTLVVIFERAGDNYCILCLCLKYLIVFNCVVAEALTLAKALRDLLRDTIGIDIRERWQVPVYLREGVGTTHVGLPNRTTGLGTVTTLVVNWAWK